MVIQAGLMKGKFNDQFLFAVQEQEDRIHREKADKLQDIKNRVAKGEKTTFSERNILKIENKKVKQKENSFDSVDEELWKEFYENKYTLIQTVKSTGDVIKCSGIETWQEAEQKGLNESEIKYYRVRKTTRSDFKAREKYLNSRPQKNMPNLWKS